jgi:hypothetical protein
MVELIYRLHIRNRRSRNNFVISHTGREFIRSLTRPLSAPMFSNTALEPTAVGAVSLPRKPSGFLIAFRGSRLLVPAWLSSVRQAQDQGKDYDDG